MKTYWDGARILPLLGVQLDDTAGLARRLGVTRRQVQRWRRTGWRMTTAAADRAALRLGLHPACVWDDWATR